MRNAAQTRRKYKRNRQKLASAEFHADIRKNDIEYSAVLVFLGSILSSLSLQVIVVNFGLPLLLGCISLMIIVVHKRNKIKKKYSLIIKR
jgi:hypothetical protein